MVYLAISKGFSYDGHDVGVGEEQVVAWAGHLQSRGHRPVVDA